jgi:anaerobic selenocysteine-containing dehydrogenase
MVRRGFYEHRAASDRSKRGAEPFVAISWEEAEQLVADELSRIRDTYGNQAIYGGCYGWASAGRFHHAKSQVHRFLTTIGGCTTSLNTYSFAAGEVIVPHVLGHDLRHWEFREGTTWPAIIEHTDLMVCFGGMPSKNVQVHNGGTGRHIQRSAMREAHQNGTQFVNISPIRADMDDDLGAQWLAPVPNTDVAIMLGMAHTLISENLHDPVFLDTYCVGFERFLQYLLGHTDDQPKSADWAAEISGLTAEQIRSLARLGHPAWFEPAEWLHSPQAMRHPLHLVSNQPKTRLHSQLDHGAYSRQHKVRDREPVTIHPEDAAQRHLHAGDVVRLFNGREACLAGALISDEVPMVLCRLQLERGTIHLSQEKSGVYANMATSTC